MSKRSEDQREALLDRLESITNEDREAFISLEQVGINFELYKNDHKYANEWYRSLPSARSRQFAQFIYSSVQLAIDVCGDESVQLLVGDVGTACANTEKMEIIIAPHTLLTESIVNRDFSLQDETAIMVAATNGMIIHEAGHLIKSPKDIEEAKRKMGLGGSIVDSGHLSCFINTCEDVYIEWWLKEEFPGLEPFVAAAHEFWFYEEDLAERIHTFWESKEVSAERYDGGAFLDVIIALKNWRFADAPIWNGILKEYNEEMKKFRHFESLEDRLSAIKTLWNKVVNDRRLRWAKIEREPGGSRLFDSDSMHSRVGGSNERERAEARGAKRGKSDARALIDEINKELNKRNIVIRIEKGQTNIAHIPPAKIQRIVSGGPALEPDKRFISMAKKLRSSLTKNYAPGQPLTRGPKLVSTRLQRIVTDGKIFTYPEKRQRTGKDYEIVILVDCSGSMSSGAPLKIEEALRVGLAAYISLRSARIRTVLLGHTTDSRGGGPEAPVIYVFGEPKDPISVVRSRAGYVLGHSGFMYNNYDGFAVEKASTFFSDKPTKKWLIVISDGQPAGHNYGGQEAIEHSRLSADNVRSRGIDVVSITIEEGAHAVNDHIYGPNKNIRTRSSKALMDLIEAMFVKHKGDPNGKA